MSKNNGLISKISLPPRQANGELSNATFAIKDNIDLADEVTGNGNPTWGTTHSRPVTNAICVEQLLSAGAACIGKTQQDELAYSLIGANEFYETLVNCKAPDRAVGGSSSGSACVVASGIVDFALGTDTGGSTRVPASNCGLWGYRPTHGYISTAGVIALAPSFDTVGVLANNGNTLYNVLKTLLASNNTDDFSQTKLCFLNDITALCSKNLHKEINLTAEKLANNFDIESTTLTEIAQQETNIMTLFETTAPLISMEIWNTLSGWLKQHNPELSPGVAFSLENYAKKANRSDILAHLHQAKLFQNKMQSYLQVNDKILCFPTTIDLAPKISDITNEFLSKGDYYPRTMGVTAVAGLSGCPEITVPLMKVQGAPVGLSFLAPRGKDLALSKTLLALKKLIPWQKTI